MSSDLTPDWSSEFEHYKKLSRKVFTNEDIIDFFNQNQKAFYLDSFSSSLFNCSLLKLSLDSYASIILAQLEEKLSR